MNQDNEYYDNTRISAFKACPRQYYLRHVLNWRREGTAIPLVFGLAWHDAMDICYGMFWGDASDRDIVEAAHKAFLKTWEESDMIPWEAMTIEDEQKMTPRTPGIAKEMLAGYVKIRRPFMVQNAELIDIERPFMVPLFEDEKKFYIGRLDKVVKINGRITILEHKTTTAYKVNGFFRTDWVESWSPNSQVDGYLHAAHVIYGAKNVDLWIDGALVHKKVHDGFKFIPVSRQTSMLDIWLSETKYWLHQIKAEQVHLDILQQEDPDTKNNLGYPLDAYPKNTNSCSHYNGCSFKDLCKTIINPEAYAEPPLGFVEDKWEPFDILNIQSILEKG